VLGAVILDGADLVQQMATEIEGPWAWAYIGEGGARRDPECQDRGLTRQWDGRGTRKC
jgi:hypothetical protein